MVVVEEQAPVAVAMVCWKWQNWWQQSDSSGRGAVRGGDGSRGGSDGVVVVQGRQWHICRGDVAAVAAAARAARKWWLW